MVIYGVILLSMAGLRFKAIINGKVTDISGGQPHISDSAAGKLVISWPLQGVPGNLKIQFTENEIHISLSGNNSLQWYLYFTTANHKELPFTSITSQSLNAVFEGMKYKVIASTGNFKNGTTPGTFMITPSKQEILLDFETNIP